jgi:hypothetical protein
MGDLLRNAGTELTTPAPARFPLQNRVLLNEALHGVVHRRVVERQPPQHQLAADIHRADPA